MKKTIQVERQYKQRPGCSQEHGISRKQEGSGMAGAEGSGELRALSVRQRGVLNSEGREDPLLPSKQPIPTR